MPLSSEQRIPKVIHYCWFSQDPFPEKIQHCLNSWKKFMPDYEIIEWNSHNFDFNHCLYTKQAYATGKYAFVSDYARLYILYHHGGIYLDSDVEILKSLDPLLVNAAFTGFESRELIAAWIMASTKGHPMIKRFLDYYTDATFIKEAGAYNLTPNTDTITDICLENGLTLNNLEQNIQELNIYPMTFFCPWRPYENKQSFTENTFTIHYFSGSWMSEKQKKLRSNPAWKLVHRLAVLSLRLLGRQKHQRLKRFLRI